MSAEIYRVMSGRVDMTGAGLSRMIIETRPQLQPARAAVDEDGDPYYVFSEKGVGPKPLVILGKPRELIELTQRYTQRYILNKIDDLPAIGVAMSHYEPGRTYRAIFPLGDAIRELTAEAANVGVGIMGGALGPSNFAGHMTNDLAGAFSLAFERLRERTIFRRRRRLALEAERVHYIKICYIPLNPGDDPTGKVGEFHRVAVCRVDERGRRVQDEDYNFSVLMIRELEYILKYLFWKKYDLQV